MDNPNGQFNLATEPTLRKNRRLFNRAIFLFLFIFMAAGAYWSGYQRGQSVSGFQEKSVPITESAIINKIPGADKNIDFSLFWKVWDLIKQKHVDKDKLDAQQMLYGSIEGMLRATGDPYSNFFNPQATKEFSQDMQGSFQGIGAELGVKDSILTIIAPLEDSPAQKAGLRSGDKILKIGDKITSDVSVDEAVDLIRGKKGTGVTLTILHLGDKDTQEATIIRDTIEVKSVKLEMRDDTVAIIKINQFGETTTAEFTTAMNQILSTKDTRGIILDLRNNPGGFLESAVDIASRMISKDKLVVSEEDNAGQKENLYTKGYDKLSDYPIVVLINEGSASASEILAAALHDNRDITLVGKKSFGKGSVQELINLPEKSSVKITVAKWLTPKGEYIMEKGISPDIEIEMTRDDYENNRDPQLDKALEILKEQIK